MNKRSMRDMWRRGGYSKAPRSIPPRFYYTPPPQGEPSVESIPPSAVYLVYLLRN